MLCELTHVSLQSKAGAASSICMLNFSNT